MHTLKTPSPCEHHATFPTSIATANASYTITKLYLDLTDNGILRKDICTGLILKTEYSKTVDINDNYDKRIRMTETQYEKRQKIINERIENDLAETRSQFLANSLHANKIYYLVASGCIFANFTLLSKFPAIIECPYTQKILFGSIILAGLSIIFQLMSTDSQIIKTTFGQNSLIYQRNREILPVNQDVLKKVNEGNLRHNKISLIFSWLGKTSFYFSACLLGILTHHIIFETNTHQHIKDASKETITTSSNANNKVLLRIDQTLKQQSTGSSTTSNKNNTKTKLVSDDSMVLITKSQPLPSIKEVKGNQKEFLDSKTGKAIIQKEVNSETTNSGINWTAVQAGVSLLAFMGLLITIRQQNKDLQIQHTDSKTQNNLLGLQREELTLQREELKLTREEMELQRQEMSGQKEQMEAQAKALQEQVNTAKTAAIIECYSDYYHNLRERLLGNQGEIIDNLNNFRGFFTNYAETADLIKQPNNFCNLTEECIEKAILRGLFNGEDYMNEIDECADKLIFICNLLPKDQTFPKIKFIKDTIMTIKTLESARIMVYSSVKKLTKQN